MADAVAGSEWNAAAVPSPGREHAQAPSTAPTLPQAPSQSVTKAQNSQKKSKSRRKNNPQGDGAVSDSVVPPTASPHAKKSQRQHSVASPAQTAKMNTAHKQRPVSVGGNMLQGTPSKEQAYAGPTFQASPAASALPMPKFLSRSVPNVAKHSTSLDSRMAGQKTPEQESSPEPDVVSPQPPPPSRSTQQSPLDLFFNAQRAENQRKASIDNMPSPKTVPPNNQDRDAYTQSLKDLLFNNTNGSPPQDKSPATPSQGQRTISSSLQGDEQRFYTPSPTQRSTSGPSTPTPTAEQQHQHYSLHYGNRNLSPLFKAARAETPPRPSNLRQQSSASDSSPIPGQQHHQSQPQPQHQVDPNSFSRSYLDQHIRNSQPTTMPGIPQNRNGFPQQQRYPPTPPAPHDHAGNQHRGPPPSGTGASPRTGSNGSRDIRSMEDDLRRMLKVNVLGN